MRQPILLMAAFQNSAYVRNSMLRGVLGVLVIDQARTDLVSAFDLTRRRFVDRVLVAGHVERWTLLVSRFVHLYPGCGCGSRDFDWAPIRMVRPVGSDRDES